MFKTISNLRRKLDKYGDLHFISFLGAILSRLVYMNDNKFLTCYNQIMGPVIHPDILEGINSVNSNNLFELLDDEKIFKLSNPENIFNEYTYIYKDKQFIDFIKLNMPQNVNIINGDLSGDIKHVVFGQPTSETTVKYI